MDCRVISAFTRVFDARLATAQCFCGTARHSAHASEGRLGPGPRELMIESTASELSDLELDEMILRLREQLAKPQDAPLMIEAKIADDDPITAH